jgi:hypothetical protein
LTTENVGSLNVFTGANVTWLTVSGGSNLVSANIVTLNTASANLTTENVGSLNVFTGANVTWLTVSGGSNLVSANIVTLNTASANITTENVGSLNVFTGANISVLTSRLANIATLNTASANITSGNVGSLNVFTGANVTWLTVSGGSNLVSANIVTLNTASANLTTENVGSLNVFTGANVTWLTVSGGSNLISANIATANISTLNVNGTANGYFVGNFSGTAFSGGSFQGSTMSGTTITASTGFTGTAFSGGSFQGSTMSGTTITASTGFTGAAFNGGTFNGGFSGTFTGSGFTGGTFYGTTANLTTSANIVTLNTASANLTTATVANLTVTSNIISGISGNTYLTGNIIVSGNVYTSLGELGTGGSVYYSLGSGYVPTNYTGSIYGSTYTLKLGNFTPNGSSTFFKQSTNGFLQFSQVGMYQLTAVFLSDLNNINGIAVGTNTVDTGPTTSQTTYLYRYTTAISQNPTEPITIQFYVGSTTLYYYVDLFSVDDFVLQPTTIGTGGTWLAIGPYNTSGTSGQTLVISTLGATVTGRTMTYSALVSDYYIGCSAGITVNLPTIGLVAGKQFVIKDESGSAATNHITIAGGGNLIDNQSSLILVINYGAVTVYWTGSFWSII